MSLHNDSRTDPVAAIRLM